MLARVAEGSHHQIFWQLMLHFLGLKFSGFVVLRPYKAPLVSVL